jgi:outer membrane protein assembly factor BamB
MNSGGANLDGLMYVWGESNQLRSFEVTFDGSSYHSTLRAETSLSDGDISLGEMPGGIASYSGNALANGIIWANHKTGIGCGTTGLAAACTGQGTFNDGQLWAIDAITMKKLWSSQDVAIRDSFGIFAKFVPPTVANGRVYMATFSNQVVVYGLLQ